MECIAAEWRNQGYKLPKLIFWNVASRTGAIPMKENQNGVVLVSGFSPAIANMVLNNETDPLLALYKVLDKKRYNCVDALFEPSEFKRKELLQVIHDYPNPEDINNQPNTAPSVRLIKLIPGYEKVLYGIEILQQHGMPTLLDRCPHFRAWVNKLETALRQ
jgi:hypothetical protein